jgi:hypothetical protein
MSLPGFRRYCALLLLALASAAHAGTDFYRGQAVTHSLRGKLQDPIVIRVNGTSLTGTLFSNALGRTIAFRDTIGAGGHFRAKIAPSSGITGAITGKVRPGGIVATGRLTSGKLGAVTLRFKAGRATPAPIGNGMPDLTGTRRLYLQYKGTPESYKSINFTLQKEANDYSYRAVFADAPSRTDKVDARVDFPTGDTLEFSNDFTYHYLFIPVKIDFAVKIAPERYRGPGVYNFAITLRYTDSAQKDLYFGYYQGYYLIQ